MSLSYFITTVLENTSISLEIKVEKLFLTLLKYSCEMQQGYLEQRILASWNFAPPFEWTEAQKAEIKIGILKHHQNFFHKQVPKKKDFTVKVSVQNSLLKVFLNFKRLV